MTGDVKDDRTTRDGRLVRVVDRWIGGGAQTTAWGAAARAAAALKRARVVERYGVTVEKAWVHVNGHKRWEYRLVLVDRTPGKGNAPATVRRIVSQPRTHA
ncbi:hypothetical protein ACIRJS_16640 [Streptomyces sp. NPDC102340]|uniref:hypothetical protein n=1 Tax=unclassified Streptomyces TaxID=2593676 RepID=UPI0037F367FD